MRSPAPCQGPCEVGTSGASYGSAFPLGAGGTRSAHGQSERPRGHCWRAKCPHGRRHDDSGCRARVPRDGDRTVTQSRGPGHLKGRAEASLGGSRPCPGLGDHVLPRWPGGRPTRRPVLVSPFWEACFSVVPWYSKPTADCSDKKKGKAGHGPRKCSNEFTTRDVPTATDHVTVLNLTC